MASRFEISPERYRALTMAALLALAAIIVTGAGVRLTGSGLGCSDWPTCEQDQFVADLEFHPMIEFGNRLITGLVSVAVILAVLGAQGRRPYRRDLSWWAWGLVAGVIAQIVLGMLVTKTELDPRVVIGHFLLSMVLVWNAVVLHHKAGSASRPYSRPSGAPDGTASEMAANQRIASLRLTQVSLAVQTAAVGVLVGGTIVTGSGPHAGSTEDEPVERLPFAVSEVARIHTAFVYLLLALVLVFAWM
ncbi:MAG: hypothetical protein HKN26_12945, partial [Acidimicrobiales bacterium]|nr:hypothetical protein [Acidimicrobiales bacterium]